MAKALSATKQQKRVRHKKIFGCVSLTPLQLDEVWTKKQNLMILQNFMLETPLEERGDRSLFLRALDQHSRVAGYCNDSKEEKQETRVIYITQEENDKAWEEKVRQQQKNLPMPSAVTDGTMATSSEIDSVTSG